MPDRVIRAGILTSDPVNTLSWPGEVFYRRLHSVVDDFGRFDGRLDILRAALYPLKIDRVTALDVGKWIAECANAGLVRRYTVSGRPYVEVLKFDQRVRAMVSKWPEPPSSADICQQPLSSASVVGDGDVFGGEKPKRARAPPFALPDWVPPDAWKSWERHRGSKLSDEARRRQIAKLADLMAKGHAPKAMVDLAIESGWATFYPPRDVSTVAGKPTIAEKRSATARAMYAKPDDDDAIDGTAERIT